MSGASKSKKTVLLTATVAPEDEEMISTDTGFLFPMPGRLVKEKALVL
jgi:hypothetical protein